VLVHLKSYSSFSSWAIKKRVKGNQLTGHEVRQQNNGRDPPRIRIGEGASVAEFPAESVRNDDNDSGCDGGRIGTGDVGWEPVDGLDGAGGFQVTAEGALEAFGAEFGD